MVGGSGLTGDVHSVTGVRETCGTALDYSAHGGNYSGSHLGRSGLGANGLWHGHLFAGLTLDHAVDSDWRANHALVWKRSLGYRHGQWSNFVDTKHRRWDVLKFPAIGSVNAERQGRVTNVTEVQLRSHAHESGVDRKRHGL